MANYSTNQAEVNTWRVPATVFYDDDDNGDTQRNEIDHIGAHYNNNPHRPLLQLRTISENGHGHGDDTRTKHTIVGQGDNDARGTTLAASQSTPVTHAPAPTVETGGITSWSTPTAITTPSAPASRDSTASTLRFIREHPSGPTQSGTDDPLDVPSITPHPPLHNSDWRQSNFFQYNASNDKKQQQQQQKTQPNANRRRDHERTHFSNDPANLRPTKRRQDYMQLLHPFGPPIASNSLYGPSMNAQIQPHLSPDISFMPDVSSVLPTPAHHSMIAKPKFIANTAANQLPRRMRRHRAPLSSLVVPPVAGHAYWTSPYISSELASHHMYIPHDYHSASTNEITQQHQLQQRHHRRRRRPPVPSNALEMAAYDNGVVPHSPQAPLSTLPTIPLLAHNSASHDAGKASDFIPVLAVSVTKTSTPSPDVVPGAQRAMSTDRRLSQTIGGTASNSLWSDDTHNDHTEPSLSLGSAIAMDGLEQYATQAPAKTVKSAVFGFIPQPPNSPLRHDPANKLEASIPAAALQEFVHDSYNLNAASTGVAYGQSAIASPFVRRASPHVFYWAPAPAPVHPGVLPADHQAQPIGVWPQYAPSRHMITSQANKRNQAVAAGNTQKNITSQNRAGEFFANAGQLLMSALPLLLAAPTLGLMLSPGFGQAAQSTGLGWPLSNLAWPARRWHASSSSTRDGPWRTHSSSNQQQLNHINQSRSLQESDIDEPLSAMSSTTTMAPQSHNRSQFSDTLRDTNISAIDHADHHITYANLGQSGSTSPVTDAFDLALGREERSEVGHDYDSNNNQNQHEIESNGNNNNNYGNKHDKNQLFEFHTSRRRPRAKRAKRHLHVSHNSAMAIDELPLLDLNNYDVEQEANFNPSIVGEQSLVDHDKTGNAAAAAVHKLKRDEQLVDGASGSKPSHQIITTMITQTIDDDGSAGQQNSAESSSQSEEVGEPAVVSRQRHQSVPKISTKANQNNNKQQQQKQLHLKESTRKALLKLGTLLAKDALTLASEEHDTEHELDGPIVESPKSANRWRRARLLATNSSSALHDSSYGHNNIMSRHKHNSTARWRHELDGAPKTPHHMRPIKDQMNLIDDDIDAPGTIIDNLAVVDFNTDHDSSPRDSTTEQTMKTAPKRNHMWLDGAASARKQVPTTSNSGATTSGIGDTQVVSDYLKHIQFSDRDKEKLMASYLTCDGLLNDSDHCLERLACEFSDRVNIAANRLDRAVSSLLLGHILANTYVPDEFKLRLRAASLYGYTNSGTCSRYSCNKLKRPFS
ncbi:hypothetical protein GZH46_02618, partial [Fragariocoptes setiger]